MGSLGKPCGSFPSASPEQRGKTMAEALKLTQASVDSFKLPSGKSDHIEFFPGFPGFGLRVRRRPGGGERASFIYQYKLDGSTFRLTLGDARKVKVAAAKEAMQIHAGEVAKGNNPAAAKRDARLSANVAKS